VIVGGPSSDPDTWPVPGGTGDAEVGAVLFEPAAMMVARPIIAAASTAPAALINAAFSANEVSGVEVPKVIFSESLPCSADLAFA
jgi:hypothetical protein